MRRLLTLLLLLGTISASGQNRSGYAYPILHIAGLHSANFGEMRPGHFHGGIDFKTDGAEGRPIVAIADGWISRVSVSPGGFGRALYLTLADGTTAIYGHLASFRKDIEEQVEADRLGNHTNTSDLWFQPGQLPVSRGQTIARSGNSGTSFGPHLHFELHDSLGRRINLIREGIFRPTDTTSPRIMRVHYIEVDTIQGVPLRTPVRSYATVPEGRGRYRLAQAGTLEAGRKGYFIVETSDRRDGVHNTFGIYRITASIDKTPYFEYRMDGFRADDSRYCNAIASYPLQIAVRNEAIRLAQLDRTPEYFYPILCNRGLVRTEPGDEHLIRIEVEDDCGNISSIEFTIRGGENTFRAQADSTAIALYPDRPQSITLNNELIAKIPAGALYEPIFCRPTSTPAPTSTSSVAILSPAYQVFEASTPLHKAITISIRAYVPPQLHTRTVLAARSPKGTLSFIGGKCDQQGVTATTRTTGEIVVVADTLPPKITPLFKAGADLTQSSSLRFRISDDFSGIDQCTLLVDGQWVPCDRYPVKGLLVHTFGSSAEKRKHEIKLYVRDHCGNTAAWTNVIYR